MKDFNEKNIVLGGRVLFGKHIWRVLDVQGNRALIITENIIRTSKYNAEDTSTSWERCTLRKYLNETFFNTFSPDEQLMIAETTLVNSYHNRTTENNTVDRIFLLSSDEVEKYFKTTRSREAYRNGVPCNWWLRTLAASNKGMLVINDGFMGMGSQITYRAGIRPALFVDIDQYAVLFDKPHLNEASFAFRKPCKNEYFAANDFKRYADAAEQGDINAMLTSAWMAYWGFGCKRDAKQSEYFLELAITESGAPSVEAIRPLKSLQTILTEECYAVLVSLALNSGVGYFSKIKKYYDDLKFIDADTVGMNNYLFKFFMGSDRADAARVILAGKKINSLLTDYKTMFVFDHDDVISYSREDNVLLLELHAEAADYKPLINKKRLNSKQKSFLDEQEQKFLDFGISLSDSWIYHNWKTDDFKLFF